MARIRSTHPDQWTDERFVTCSPLARLLALALRNEADDGGVFQWRPVQLKIRLLAADNCEITDLLAELEAAHIIRQYEVRGAHYGAIRNFKKFQCPKKPREVHPRVEWVASYVGTRGEEVPNEFPTDDVPVPIGRDGKGEEGSGERFGAEPTPPADPDSELDDLPPGKPAPTLDGLTLDEGDLALASRLGVDARDSLARFRDHCRAKGKSWKNYRAALRNWMRNDAKFKAERRANGSLPLGGSPGAKSVPRQTNNLSIEDIERRGIDPYAPLPERVR